MIDRPVLRSDGEIDLREARLRETGQQIRTIKKLFSAEANQDMQSSRAYRLTPFFEPDWLSAWARRDQLSSAEPQPRRRRRGLFFGTGRVRQLVDACRNASRLIAPQQRGLPLAAWKKRQGQNRLPGLILYDHRQRQVILVAALFS